MDYNKRLNDVIQNAYTVGQQFGTTTEELKQAITSLIKELVAEAKPKTMPSNLSPENYERCERVVNQYHQNILKALEEVWSI